MNFQRYVNQFGSISFDSKTKSIMIYYWLCVLLKSSSKAKSREKITVIIVTLQEELWSNKCCQGWDMYQIYLCSTYCRVSTRFYAKLGSARIPNLFEVLKLWDHWDVRDTFLAWKFLLDLPFQLYRLQYIGCLEDFCNLFASGNSELAISCQGNGRFAQTLSHKNPYWTYFSIQT